jgi:hypothetical protein
MAYNNFPPIGKIFDDLDKFRDYCRFEGKVFNEADLYNDKAYVWQQYQKYQNYLRAKARNNGKPFERKPRNNNYQGRN